MKYYSLLVCFIVAARYPSFSQAHSVSEELRFTQYLIDNKQYDDAVYVLKSKTGAVENISSMAADSLNYYLGWCYYNLKALDSSSLYFSKVPHGPFYFKAAFYTAFNLAYGGEINAAGNSLNGIYAGKDSSIIKLQNFERAGLALLGQDYLSYEELAKKFSYNYFPVSEEEKKFAGHYSNLKKIRKKSPALAGAMSALIPGSGKIYAGYAGQGIAALITVGVLGVSAAENYSRFGYKSPHFVALGSVFAVFYFGNIWGSTLSVKLAKQQQTEEIKDAILFDMHIPLRRIFN